MEVDTLKVKCPLHEEFRSISSAVAAFSIATTLVIIQGGFHVDHQAVFLATVLFLISAPTCMGASIISYHFTLVGTVPSLADRVLDWLMNLGWATGIVGFVFLVWSVDHFFAVVFLTAVGLSIAVATAVFVIIAKARALEVQE